MYQIIFGAVPSELFPRFFTLIEEETIRRVYELHQKLSGKLSKKNQAKLQVLNDALARASSRLNDLAI